MCSVILEHENVTAEAGVDDAANHWLSGAHDLMVNEKGA